MSEPSFASLNPALLARKGGAKPAMRRQLGAAPAKEGQLEADLEDLGWNDMGSEPNPSYAESTTDPDISADVVAISSVADFADGETVSPARVQQDAIADRIGKPAKAKAKSKSKTKSQKKQTQSTSATKRRSALKQGRRAAFTLRLNADRHLKLRLAATIKGVSAQSFVSDALDASLAEIEELETLAASIKRN